MRKWLLACVAVLLPVLAWPQSAPNWPTGYRPSSAELNAAFAGKQDVGAGFISPTITTPAITGGTINNTAISGGSVSGAAVSGGSVSGAAISGGTINGSAITGTPISGSTGSFTTIMGDAGATVATATGGSTSRILADRSAQQINVLDYGGKNDIVSYLDGVYTSGSTAFSSAKGTFTAADIGKPIFISGAGVNGITLATTVAGVTPDHALTLTAAPSASNNTFFATSTIVTTSQSGGGSYTVNDTLVVSGGTSTVAAAFKVLKTKVNTVAVNAAGAGGTNTTSANSCVVTGTTGTGRKFRVGPNTIAAGAISVLGPVIDAGEYTVNPTSLAAEPVTGCNLTGATLTLTQGVSIAGIVTPGTYTVKPANPAATTSGGSGTGATLTLQYNAGGTYAVGSDNTAAISAAIAQSNSLYAIGTHTCVYFPSRDSRSPGGVGYLAVSSPTQFSKGNPGCILGDGGDRSVVRMGSTFTGNLFSWDDAWYENDHPLLGTTPMSSVKNGPLARGIGVVGDTASAGLQTAFEFLDIVSHILFDDVTCKYVHGYCIVGGINHPFEGNYGPGESRFYNVRVESSGSDTVPAMLMTAGGAGDSSNQIEFFGLEFLRCYGKCMVLDSGTSTAPLGGLKGYRFFSPRFERSMVGDDLVVLGDPVHTGTTNGITMYGFTGNHSDADHAIVRITAPGASNQPYDIYIDGSFDGGPGIGVAIDAGRLINIHATVVGGTPYSYMIGPSPVVFTPINIDGLIAASTVNIDPSSVGSVFTTFRYAGVPSDVGAGSVNLQTAQTAFGNTASANSCVVVANGTSRCSGAGGIVIGATNSITQAKSIVIGDAAVNGSNLTFMTGTGPNDNGAQGHRVHSTGFIAATGDTQVGDHQLKGLTTNATPTVLTSNTSGTASTGHIGELAINSANMGPLRCLARDIATGAVGAWYDPNVVTTKGANGASFLLKLSGLTSVFADAAAATWTLAATADTTFGGQKLTFTGEAAKTIHVLCSYGPLVELK